MSSAEERAAGGAGARGAAGGAAREGRVVGGAGGATGARRAGGAAWRWLFAALVLSVFLPATTQSLLIPAVPELMRLHGGSRDDTTWVLTAFLVVASAAAPLGGRLGALFGRRRTLLALLAAYVAGSLVCALAGSLGTLIAGRALQGCVGGTFAIAVSLARDHALPGRARISVALLSVVVGVGTSAGFALGGAIADHAPIALAFWGGAGCGALALALAALLVPREAGAAPAVPGEAGAAPAVPAAVGARPSRPREPRAGRERFDLLGAVLLLAGTALPLVAISQANRWGLLDPRTVALALLGTAVAVAWVRVERRRAPRAGVAGALSSDGDESAPMTVRGAPSPRGGRRRGRPQALIDVGALGARPVLLGNVATLLLGVGMFGLFVLTPQLVQQPARAGGAGLGLGATAAGLVLLPGALAMLLVGPLATRIGGRWGDHVALAAGSATTAIGLALLAGARGGLASVIAWALVAAVGLGIAMPAMPALVAGAAPRERIADAVGFNALLRGAGSAVGAQVSGAVLAATVVAGAPPTAAGYAWGYALAAGSAAAAALVALAVRPRRRAHVR